MIETIFILCGVLAIAWLIVSATRNAFERRSTARARHVRRAMPRSPVRQFFDTFKLD